MPLVGHIYKNNGGDCSAGGLSSTADALCLMNVDGGSEPSEKYPAALLVGGAYPGIARIIPAKDDCGEWVPDRDPDKVGPMFGGCYVAVSDDRFVKAVEKITGGRFYGAVPLHDRFETTKEYASYD